MSGVPLIAVTTSEMRSRRTGAAGATPEADPPRDEMVLGLRYLQALGAAGCVPVVVPPLPPSQIEPLLERVQGVCLSGGPDLDPATYGADPHPRLGPTEPQLDAFELAFARAADARGLPVLAICRGAQLMNVARGGTLHQHLPDLVGDEVAHRQGAIGSEPSHPIRLQEGTLATALGRDVVEVNSFHHQAVDRLGQGLRAVGWSPDGVVEAFEDATGRFVVGVQWHAEALVDHPEQEALFAAFVRACTPGAAGSGAVRAA